MLSLSAENFNLGDNGRGNSAIESGIDTHYRTKHKQELPISSGSSANEVEFGKVSGGEERVKVSKGKCFPESVSK